MNIHNLDDFIGGWVIGDFLPSLHRTKDFEVGIKRHSAGEHIAPHRHNLTTEFNVVISGKMIINGDIMCPGDIFILHPRESVWPVAVVDSVIVVIKTPSVPDDKEEI